MITTGFDEELDNLELKIANTVRKRDLNSESLVDDNKIKIGNVVAVFVPDWHKWIRASIRKKEVQDRYCVWAIDYGVPMVTKASNIVKLPNRFKGMSLEKDRIQTGGIENCIPAEIKYDIATASSVKESLSNWTMDAIELTQKILKNSVKLEFEHVQEYRPSLKPHYFGRLMMQRQDKQRLNVVKCLLDMNMAALTEGKFGDEIKMLETLQQLNFTSAKGEILDTSLVVTPVLVAIDDTGYTDKEIFDDESIYMEDNLPEFVDDNEFFDESVSMMRPINSLKLSVKKAEEQTKSEAANETVSKSGISTNSSEHEEKSSQRSLSNKNRQQNGSQSGFNHADDASKNDDRKDQRRSNNQLPNYNNQKPQQFQQQRGLSQNRSNMRSNQFNGQSHTFVPPNLIQMQSHLDQQQGRKYGSGYANKFSYPKRQGKNNRNVQPRKELGDAEFAASIGYRPFDRNYEHHSNAKNIAYDSNAANFAMGSTNRHMNVPFFPPFPSQGPSLTVEYNQRNQPNERRHNRQNHFRNQNQNQPKAASNRNNNGKKLSEQCATQPINKENDNVKTTKLKMTHETDENQSKSNDQEIPKGNNMNQTNASTQQNASE